MLSSVRSITVVKTGQKVSFCIICDYIFIGQNYNENTKIFNLMSLFANPYLDWGQTLLPDRSILIRQNLMENATYQI